MNILTISAEKANYVPSKIYATSVSGAGGNTHGASAIEIATDILNRKLAAAVPIEMGIGIHDAQITGNSAMFARGMESLNNLLGSTLLNLKAEAEEGSLLLKLINERLEDFRKEFGEPVTDYIPFIPPSTGAVIFGGMAEVGTPGSASGSGNGQTEDNLPPAVSKEDAALALKLEEKRIARRAQNLAQKILDAVMGELLDGNSAATNQPNPVADTSMVQDAIQKYATPQATEIPVISEEAAAALHIPLTEREKAFAKMFKINEKLRKSFGMTLAAMESGDEAKKAEALELNAEARRVQQEHAELFTPGSWGEFFYAMHGTEPPIVVGNGFGTHLNGTQYFKAVFTDMPPGEFSYDSLTNAVLIGMGSKIPLGHFSLHVHDNTVGAFQNHVRNPHPDIVEGEGRVRSFYVQTLNWLLHASHTGNSSLNTNSTAYTDALNHTVLSLLQKMGVDTSREFSINGTAFSVRNGRVETLGYTPFTNPNPVREYIGMEGMKQIFACAYAQNLFNPTTD